MKSAVFWLQMWSINKIQSHRVQLLINKANVMSTNSLRCTQSPFTTSNLYKVQLNNLVLSERTYSIFQIHYIRNYQTINLRHSTLEIVVVFILYLHIWFIYGHVDWCMLNAHLLTKTLVYQHLKSNYKK